MKLRPYRKYRTSGVEWIGAVPEHWTVAGVKRRYDIQLGKMLQTKPKSVDDVEVRYFKARHVQWCHVEAAEVPRMWASPEALDRFRVVPGDLLVCEGGEGGRCAILGRVDVDHIIQNALHRVRPRARSSNRFLQYVLRIVAGTGWLERLNDKATIAHLIKEKLGALRIPCAPPSEQGEIVRFLDHADRRIQRYIRAKGKLIGLLEERKQAGIHQAVTGQIDVRSGQPYPMYKDSGVEWLGEVPEHWGVRSFTRNCVEISDYRGATPRKTDSGVFLVTAKNIRRGWIDYDASREFVAEKEYSSIMRRGLPRAGDLLITTEAPLGFAALVGREDIALAQRVIRFRLDERVFMPGFGLHSVLDSYFQNQLQCRGTGSTALGIKASKLPQLEIICPPISEQRAILIHCQGALDNSERRSAAAAGLIGLLEEYRARLIADVVTGKLDVREAAAALPEMDPLDVDDSRRESEGNTSVGPHAADASLVSAHP